MRDRFFFFFSSREVHIMYRRRRVLTSLALFFCSTVLAASVAGCSSAGDDEADEAGDESVESAENGVSVQGRWLPSDSALAAANRVTHGIDGASGSCVPGMLPGTKLLASKISETFAQNIASPGDGLPAVQGYNCRRVRGSSAPSMHGMGRALDVFIPRAGGAADNTKGDLIANWILRNAAALGVQRVIWDRTIWEADDKVARPYSGVHAHDDHIHFEITKEAASKELDWYRTTPTLP